MAHVTRASIGNVMYPVADVVAAAEFYHRALTLPVKFVDGVRFAMLDAGTPLALAGPGEDLAGTSIVASFNVIDVNASLEAMLDAGGTLRVAPSAGPHETRAVAEDPWGNAFVLYTSRS
ncbi:MULTISPECIES: VOC family protein [Mycolicibacterium]|nr:MULTISPECIES: VOC family protein [Mycolicibacterium]